MSQEQEKQSKLLAKLQWMNERSRIDFKGNPGPFEVKKTQQSVEREKEQRTRLQVSDVPFLPFNHTKGPLALDATRTNYLRGLPHETFDASRARQATERASHTYGPQRQRVDPETGLTEVQRALCWGTPSLARPTTAATRDVPPHSNGEASACADAAVCCCCCCPCGEAVKRLAASASCGYSAQPARSSRTTARMDPVTLGTLPVDQRSHAYREQMINHPKFTQESARAQSARWTCGSQLAAPIAAPPRRGRQPGHFVCRVDAQGRPCGVVDAADHRHDSKTQRTRNPIHMRVQVP